MTKSITTASISRETAVASSTRRSYRHVQSASRLRSPSSTPPVTCARSGALMAARFSPSRYLPSTRASGFPPRLIYPTHVWNDYVFRTIQSGAAVAPDGRCRRSYPIWKTGKLIGGIGISGGNYQQDQGCVRRGHSRKIGFELPA